MSKTWAKGSTPRWRNTRTIVLARDLWRCQLQLRGCTTRATQVHHTVPRDVAGDNPEHLVACCQHCNGSAGEPGRHDPPPRPSRWW